MNVFSNPIADKEKVEAVEIDKSQNSVKYGDVFFTTSSETPEEVGMSCVWLENTENTYLNSFCFGYRPTINIDPYFMAYVLRSDTVRKKIVFLAQGISRYNISKNKVMEIEIPLPTTEEQRLLGKYFNNLDNLITLHQRKAFYYTPKIFVWEQRKLEDLCDLFTDGDWIEAKDQSNLGVRLIQTGNVGTTEYLDKENNKKWISEDTFNRLHCKEIFPGDILISRLPEPAGRACIMPDLGTRMITAVDCTIVRTSEECDSKYLVQYLSTPSYFKIVNSFLGGGTRQRISRGNLSGINIPMPKFIDEQKIIGEYFENIDNLITLHRRA